LRIHELPTFKEIEENKDALTKACIALYGCSEKNISFVEVDTSFSYPGSVNRANVLFSDNATNSFYFKDVYEKAWVASEACGMALANLLFKPYYNFAVSISNEIVVSQEIPGKRISDISYDEWDDESTRNYGKAFQIASSLGLPDRHNWNVIFTPFKDIINIDLGDTFEVNPGSENLYNGSLRDYLPAPQNKNVFNQGREEAKEIIRRNFKDKRELAEAIIYEALKQSDFPERIKGSSYEKAKCLIGEITSHLGVE